MVSHRSSWKGKCCTPRTELRHYLLRRLPYALSYAEVEEALWLVAIAHGTHRQTTGEGVRLDGVSWEERSPKELSCNLLTRLTLHHSSFRAVHLPEAV